MEFLDMVKRLQLMYGLRNTFGRIGNDFYFSGELAKEFPIQSQSFVND